MAKNTPQPKLIATAGTIDDDDDIDDDGSILIFKLRASTIMLLPPIIIHEASVFNFFMYDTYFVRT